MVELNGKTDEIGEDAIHFELYRFLRNRVAANNYAGPVKYLDVIPEATAADRAADLLIRASVNGDSSNFLVVEVKKKVSEGLKVFDDDAKNQAHEYAHVLFAPYYCITDGSYLRLFRAKDDFLIGNYDFSLDETAADRLLNGLAEIHMGKALGLQFKIVEDRQKRIKELSDKLTNMFSALFDELAGKNHISLTRKGHMKYLGIGNNKKIISLEIQNDCSKNTFSIYPKALKKMLNENEIGASIRKLSEIPGFQWVKQRMNLEKESVFAFIKNIAIDDPQLTQTYEGLKEWIIKLADTQ